MIKDVIETVTVGGAEYRLVELVGGGFCVLGPNDFKMVFTNRKEAEEYFSKLRRGDIDEPRPSILEVKEGDGSEPSKQTGKGSAAPRRMKRR